MAEKKTVLIVDDDPDVLEATKVVLKGGGYAVETASSGEEGMERICAGGVDVVLLDVMMTRDTEGFGMARDLRADPKTADLPIVMMTSVSQATGFEFSPETDADYLPVDAFLEKPVDPKDLLAAVEKVLSA